MFPFCRLYGERWGRKDYLWSERVNASRMMWQGEEARARERQEEGGRAGGQAVGNLPEAYTGRARDKVAARLCVKPRSVVKAVASGER